MAIKLGGDYQFRSRKKRPGVHAKTKTSNHKNSKNYKKKYRGQGNRRKANENNGKASYDNEGN